GIGRAWSVSIADSMFLSQDGLASLSSPAALLERPGHLVVAPELPARRQHNPDFAFSVDVTGNGGGIEIEAEWSATGRALSGAPSVADAVGRVGHRPLRIVDAQAGMATTVE